MRRGLSRPCTIVIFALFFSRLRRCKNVQPIFFPACVAAACTIVMFFSVLRRNLCRLFTLVICKKKNIAPKARQVFQANFAADYAIGILALFLLASCYSPWTALYYCVLPHFFSRLRRDKNYQTGRWRYKKILCHIRLPNTKP